MQSSSTFGIARRRWTAPKMLTRLLAMLCCCTLPPNNRLQSCQYPYPHLPYPPPVLVRNSLAATPTQRKKAQRQNPHYCQHNPKKYQAQKKAPIQLEKKLQHQLKLRYERLHNWRQNHQRSNPQPHENLQQDETLQVQQQDRRCFSSGIGVFFCTWFRFFAGFSAADAASAEHSAVAASSASTEWKLKFSELELVAGRAARHKDTGLRYGSLLALRSSRALPTIAATFEAASGAAW